MNSNMYNTMMTKLASLMGSPKTGYTNQYESIEKRVGLRGYYALRKTKYGSKLVVADRSKPVDISKYYLEPIVGMRNPEKRRGRRAIKLLTQGEKNGN